MHASIPTTYVSLIFVYSFLFSHFFLVLPLLLSLISSLFYYLQLSLIILSVIMGFTIFTPQLLLAHSGCPFETTHWPTGYSATTIALNMLVAPLPIPRQKWLVMFLTFLCFHYSHLDKNQASLSPTSMVCIKWFQLILTYFG